MPVTEIAEEAKTDPSAPPAENSEAAKPAEEISPEAGIQPAAVSEQEGQPAEKPKEEPAKETTPSYTEREKQMQFMI